MSWELLHWMHWTPETAIFFVAIFLMLVGFTIAEVYYPTVERKGFLPIATTRGDRLFQSLLSGAYIHLFWLLIVGNTVLWVASIISFIWLIVMLRWG